MLLEKEAAIALAKRADLSGPAPGNFLAAALGLQEACAGLCGVLQAAAAIGADPEVTSLRMRRELAGAATALLRCCGACGAPDSAMAAFAQDAQMFPDKPVGGFAASTEAAGLMREAIGILGSADGGRAAPRLALALAGERLRRIARLFGVDGDFEAIVRGDGVVP